MDIFKFKQFDINQTNCVHKVGTDGALLGMFAPIYQSSKILDIGTGTGLVALMLAQRTTNEVFIDALEINEIAFKAAEENFKNSPWNHKLKVINEDFLAFAEHNTAIYTHIVSNPPYFANAFLSPSNDKNLARHQTDKLLYNWLKGIKKCLKTDTGSCTMILPVQEAEELIGYLPQFDLHVQHTIAIHSFDDKPEIRKIVTFGNENTSSTPKRLVLYAEQGKYTSDYITLAKDFFTIF